ncbi:growth inhibitor PemK [Olsenella sp. An285]|uniref:type II toxin-antitoxin system PemK/MazF family toxin n=1 Tax=Olsenella sp. An285 TaxID=1965621 RepID=UPI000B579B52|nr:type II toxin-antitoxin system PemK/MazF family toxin [Olsenella sp. An285]OUO48553.1 growth inhibitor PemK [Olsenella sp. An285]
MRGEIWTMRDDLYASKARPVVIVQSDSVAGFDSIVLCLMTTYESSGMPTRVRVEPFAQNGLERTSFVMADKIASVSRGMLGKRIGVLERDRMDEVTAKLAMVLDIS